MTHKFSIPVVALALVMAFSASQALAQSSPQGDPTLSKAWDSHRLKVDSLQDQLWSKSMEYEALANNPNTKPAEVKSIVDQMSKLQSQIRTERDNYYTKAGAKAYGPQSYQDGYDGWHNSYNNGHRSYRGDYGHRSYRGDYGHRSYRGDNGNRSYRGGYGHRGGGHGGGCWR